MVSGLVITILDAAADGTRTSGACALDPRTFDSVVGGLVTATCSADRAGVGRDARRIAQVLQMGVNVLRGRPLV